ncbi:MAG: hypothetical protein HQL66_07595 [Magnetococcales bacterium]|nr:hypothetical protein [Magnetococcales bacterium]
MSESRETDPPATQPQPAPRTFHDLTAEITGHFLEAMELRTGLVLNVARRVTVLMRATMLYFGLLGVLLSVIIHILTIQMGDLISTVEIINRHFTQMTRDMETMQHEVGAIGAKVHAMPVITSEVVKMQESMQRLGDNVESISGLMNGITRNLGEITGDVNRMSYTFQAMDHQVSGIGAGVNRMSGPMKMFNSIMPVPR